MDLDDDPRAVPPLGSPALSDLENLIATEDSDFLELGVKTALEVLDSLKAPLRAASASQTEAPEWLQKIENCEKEYQPPRTVIGVIGNTGAGKSSILNAVLDEERLLPTSCLRACTGCPIEISYNYSDNLHRAEIEFISIAEWVEELRQLLPDLLTGDSRISPEIKQPKTPAGIAYAKVKAVYHRITNTQLLHTTPEQLGNDLAVRSVLSTVKVLNKNTASELYHSLRNHVVSMDNNENPRMELWPLIKVVRIYTKAKALSTGAVLVDLPGLRDNNVARAAVAETYLRSCTAVWIVSPIIRASDDETARKILERQMQFDGYSQTTFICSKTDDISIDEETEGYLDAEHDNIRDDLSAVNISIKSLKDRHAFLEDQMEKTNKDEVKLHNERDGLEVSIDAQLGQIRQKRQGFLDALRDLEDREKQLQEQSDELNAEIKTACIKGRNEFVKGEIRQDFVNGLQQRDAAIAMQHDEDDYDPDQPLEDHDEAGRNLPVFCVSSSVYQRLSGRMQKDCFDTMRLNIADTEIPGLQQHSRKLADARRMEVYRLFLGSVNVLLNSMKIWAQNVGRGPSLSETEEEKERSVLLQQKLLELKAALDKASGACIRQMKKALEVDVFSHYEEAVNSASEAALNTVNVWGYLHYWTYRAICRHDGVFRSSRGAHNFNAALSGPILDSLIAGWDAAFESSLPAKLKRFKKNATKGLRDFHLNTVFAFQVYAADTSKVEVLQQQLNNRNVEFIAKVDEVLGVLTSTRRESNRCFESVVQAAMQEAYVFCRSESGKGSLKRMKDKRRNHVEKNRRSMFRQATDEVRDQLLDMCDRVEGLLSQKVDELSTSLDQDYRRVLLPNTEAAHNMQSPSERALRREMDRHLKEANKSFNKLLFSQQSTQEGLDVDGDSEMLNA